MSVILRTVSCIQRHPILVTLAMIWLCILFIQPESLNVLMQYGVFLFLGIVGAVFANATGAGGGVVFVPFFSQLAMDNATILATSFAIQCCGMTAGAITWWRHYYAHNRCVLSVSDKSVTVNDDAYKETLQWCAFAKILVVTIPLSISGIFLTQYVFTTDSSTTQANLHLYFGIFSVLLSLCIFASLTRLGEKGSRFTLSLVDVISLPLISFVGGCITAFLSVGVGELIAVYLILRGFNVTMSIASAVILSAFTVWSAIYYHAIVTFDVYWQVAFFAGAGAIIGGIVAKQVVLFFSPVKLKVFFATWVLIMGVAVLPIF